MGMKKLKLLLLMPMFVSGISSVAQTNYIPQTGDAITTDNGKYIVKGSNLITNPSFADGLNGWTAGDGAALSETNFSVIATGGPDGGPCLKALGGAGSSKPQSIKTGWAIEAGKTYLFSCWTYRTKSGMSSNTQYSKLYESDSQTATTSQIGALSYTADTWKNTQVVFTATKSYCVANFAWLNSASSFAYFYLGEVELSNELVTEKLSSLIHNADSIYSSTASNEGTGILQFTAEVRATFLAAINAAKSTLTSATTQTQINDAYTTLNTALQTFNNSQNPPFVVGDKYFIVHRGSGLYLTTSGNAGKAIFVSTNTNLNTQIFIFEKAPDGSGSAGYNIKDLDGNYIYRSGSWNTFSGTTTQTDNNAIFNCVIDGDYFQIKNMASGSVLGTDASTEGALVYSNKNGKGVANYDWTIVKYSVTISLQALIDNVEKTISETSVGSKFGQVSQASMDAITSAVNKAKAAVETVTTFEEANAAITELNTAYTTFKSSYNPLSEFDVTKVYGITHSSGNMLTLERSGNAAITALATNDSVASLQRITLVPVPCDTLSMLYRIKSTDNDSMYLAMSGTYNAVWQTKSDTIAALFQLVQLDGKYIGMKCMNNGKYIGTDGTTDGSAIYSDKSGTGNINAYWTIDEYKMKSSLNKDVLDSVIAKADTLAVNMVQGYKAGQYYLTDINAFAEIVKAIKVERSAATKQNVVDSLVQVVKNRISEYKAKAHATDCSIADYIADLVTVYMVEYNAAVVGTERGQYPAAAKQAFLDAMNTAKNTASPTEETLNTLLKAHETLLASVCDVDYTSLKKAIDAANAVAAAAVVGDCDGQFAQKDLDTYKAVITSAQSAYENKTLTQNQVDSVTKDLTSAGSTFAALAVKIDFTSLASTISTANDVMTTATAEKGTGPGTYPESAFTALQTVVDNATAVKGSKTVNQIYVNGVVENLLTAIETFKASRVPNDYSKLDSLIKVAQSLYENTPVGTDAGMVSSDMHTYLKESIDKNKAALTSTSQTDIDKAAKIMSRDIALFRNKIVTGISSVELSDVKLYSHNNMLMISNIPEGAKTSIFTSNGMNVYSAVNKGDVNKYLNAGVYIVVVQSGNNKMTKQIEVK